MLDNAKHHWQTSLHIILKSCILACTGLVGASRKSPCPVIIIIIIIIIRLDNVDNRMYVAEIWSGI